MKAFVFLLTFLMAPYAFASIIPNSVSVGGHSNRVQTSDTTFQVYGSFLGANHGSDISVVYDSCSDASTIATFMGCNTRKVHGETLITVSFRDNITYEGNRQILAYVQNAGSATSTPVDLVVPNGNSFPAGSNYTANIKWSEICEQIGGTMASNFVVGAYTLNNVCTEGGVIKNGSVTVTLGVANESNNGVVSAVTLNVTIFTPPPSQGVYNVDFSGAADITGDDGHTTKTPCEGTMFGTPTGVTATGYFLLCDFAITPGDSKVKISTTASIVNSLYFLGGQANDGATSIPVKGVRLFLSNAGFASALPGTPGTTSTNIDFLVPGDTSALERVLVETDATANGAPVFARMAAVDMANNVNHLTGDSLIEGKPECDTAGASPGFSVPAMDATEANGFYIGPDSCPYATVPNQVSGLLSEDVNCFVATALRGSSDYQVIALRQFRDRFLKTNTLGKMFVDFYYTHGPKAAQWLDKNSEYKPAFRVLLWPAYLGARIFNAFGFVGGLVLILLFAFFISKGARQAKSLLKN